MTNSAEKRWKGWGSCYSPVTFSAPHYLPLFGGTATPCGVQACTTGQEAPNCSPTWPKYKKWCMATLLGVLPSSLWNGCPNKYISQMDFFFPTFTLPSHYLQQQSGVGWLYYRLVELGLTWNNGNRQKDIGIIWMADASPSHWSCF